MAILTSKKPSATYKSLLQVGTADNQELDSTARVIEDGAGNDSSLWISTSEILVKSLTANSVGGGFDAASVTSYISKVNGIIETTFLIDIADLVVSDTVKDIIGENGIAASYITQITTAVNGKIFRAEMACVESPAGTNTTADIDLVTSSLSQSEDTVYDALGTAVSLIAPSASWLSGSYQASTYLTDMRNCVDGYLYLVNGVGGNGGGTYTAGKFVIKLHGASF